jgi:hypothetical protein
MDDYNSLVDCDQCFGGIFYLEDRGSRFLKITGFFLPDYKASHHIFSHHYQNLKSNNHSVP